MVSRCAASVPVLSFTQRQNGELSEDTAWLSCLQAALGLHHLHSKNILHRDVKSMNLFLTETDQVKIGDLGVARMLGSESFAHTVTGTPYNLSPELCEGRPYRDKSDVWALGVVLYELCTLRHPFDAANQGALILRIIRGRPEPLPAVYAASKLQRVLDACLRKDTNLRPTLTQILASASVYSKARALGLTPLPPDVEALVESRKHTAVLKEQKASAAAAAAAAAAASSASAVATAASSSSAAAVAPLPPPAVLISCRR